MTTSTTTARAPSAPAQRGPAVRVRGLTKAYGDRTAVDGLDLDVADASVTGFVGPNGAGKTTTIRMLLGLVRPTAGSGEVLGRPLGSPAAYLGEVGALIEGPAFYPALSGRDNLLVLAHVGRLPRSRVDEALERVGLGPRGHDPFRSYSLGMKQRLGIAAALLPRPRLLVLDEPTNGLDPAGIAQTRALLASLRDDGTAVLVSSHLLAEVEQVADSLVLVSAGRLLFSGPVGELVRAQAPRLHLDVLETGDAVRVLRTASALGLAARLDPDGGRRVLVDLPPGLGAAEARARAAELNRCAADAGVALAGVAVHRPTLEQAFLDMTGTSSGDVR